MPVPNGLYCPKCKGKGARVTARYRPLPGVRVRYFRCGTCGYRFRSTERIGAPIHPKKIPTGESP